MSQLDSNIYHMKIGPEPDLYLSQRLDLDPYFQSLLFVTHIWKTQDTIFFLYSRICTFDQRSVSQSDSQHWFVELKNIGVQDSVDEQLMGQIRNMEDTISSVLVALEYGPDMATIYRLNQGCIYTVYDDIKTM